MQYDKIIVLAIFPQLTYHFSPSQPRTVTGRVTILRQNTLWLFDMSDSRAISTIT